MKKSVIVTLPHQHTKAEAMKRIREGLEKMKPQLAPYTSSLEEEWHGGELHFIDNGVHVAVPLPGAAAVSETGLYIKLGLAGHGLMQLAETLVREHVQTGALVEVLADRRPAPVPVSLL